MNKQAAYILTTRDGGRFTLSASGAILKDHDRGLEFSGESWRILGFTKRHHSRDIIPIEAAARGEDIGQGWVHDLDHGTHRMWGHPTGRRAVSVRPVHGSVTP